MKGKGTDTVMPTEGENVGVGVRKVQVIHTGKGNAPGRVLAPGSYLRFKWNKILSPESKLGFCLMARVCQ